MIYIDFRMYKQIYIDEKKRKIVGSDVKSFFKNDIQLKYSIDYIKEDGSIGRYHPDFYLTLNNGERWVIETKGAEEVNAQRKIQRLKVWCEDATLSQGVKWDCLYVRQENWNKLKNFPNSFDEIIKIFEVSKIKETQ